MSLLKAATELVLKNFFPYTARCLSTSNLLQREFRKNKRFNIVLKDDRVPQEKTFEVGPAWIKKCDFPDENTNNLLFNGVRFDDLPIVYIRVSKNNTIFMLNNGKGHNVYTRSCGVEGFKNAKKGTNIAAQATAVTFSTKIQKKGFKQIRIAIRGLGPGRMASIKGLEMGGLDIVSITDRTPFVLGGPRPRKQRRV